MAKDLLACVAIMVCIAGAGADVCHTSGECASGSCCRDTSNAVLSRPQGDYFMHFPQPTGLGTCSVGKAQKGDVCDSHCQCDTGLECYRPVSGLCCPPMKCYDANYVHKQKEYWKRCYADPNCPIPP